MKGGVFESILIQGEATVRDAISAIDQGGNEIALVVDADRRLIGTVSDGDVRRALLNGVTVDDGIEAVVHAEPVAAAAGSDAATLLRLMTTHAIEQIPLLDDGGRPVDLATLRELVQETVDTPVVVMAGGQGLRLRPLTQGTPKPMLPVGADERPLLETTLSQIADAGFRRVVIALNYRGQTIEGHFGDGSEIGLDISYVRETTTLGSAGALKLARDDLDRPFIVMNGDLLTNVNLGALVRFHKHDRNAITIGVRQYVLQVPYGVVELTGTRVTELREKPTVAFYVNAGVYAVEPSAVELLGSDITEFDMTDMIDAALAADLRVGSFPIREYWLDIGQLSDYERAQEDHATFFSGTG